MEEKLRQCRFVKIENIWSDTKGIQLWAFNDTEIMCICQYAITDLSLDWKEIKYNTFPSYAPGDMYKVVSNAVHSFAASSSNIQQYYLWRKEEPELTWNDLLLGLLPAEFPGVEIQYAEIPYHILSEFARQKFLAKSDFSASLIQYFKYG